VGNIVKNNNHSRNAALRRTDQATVAQTRRCARWSLPWDLHTSFVAKLI